MVPILPRRRSRQKGALRHVSAHAMLISGDVIFGDLSLNRS